MQTDFAQLTPEQILTLTSEAIPALVEEAVELDRIAGEMLQRVAVYKSRLVAEAAMELRKDPALQTLEESSYSFTGFKGNAAQVSFPRRRKIGNIFFVGDDAFTSKEDKARKLGDIKGVAGESFNKLFAKFYKPAKDFASLCKVLLTKPKAENLIHMCSEPSNPVVRFKTKE